MKLKVFIKSTFILFISACFLHFVYQWTNNNYLIGFISPINESIFEHTKLILIPLFVFHILYYVKNKNILDINKYSFTTLLSIILGITLVPMLYYFYTESFGIESLVIDISITYIVFLITNIFFYTYYKYGGFYLNFKVSSFLVLGIFLFYMYATTHTINLPIFANN